MSAELGVERKKSIRNSTLRYARSLLPRSTPSGTPITAAMRNASSVRITVTAKSISSGPPARPVTSACSVSIGVGSRIALISPARTTRSQTTKSATGPTKGSSLPHENFFGARAASVDALARVSEKTGRPAVEVLEQAIKALTPSLEVRSRRVGGANYQVPIEVPGRRARTLAIRWLIQFARGRREKQMVDKLANEILDATAQQGGAFKKKDDIYRMAQANKAFEHYPW